MIVPIEALAAIFGAITTVVATISAFSLRGLSQQWKVLKESYEVASKDRDYYHNMYFASVKDFSEKIGEIRTRLDRAETENSNLHERIEELERQLEVSNQTKADLQRQLNEERTQRMALETQLQAEHTKVLRLTDELEQVRAELSALKLQMPKFVQ